MYLKKYSVCSVQFITMALKAMPLQEVVMAVIPILVFKSWLFGCYTAAQVNQTFFPSVWMKLLNLQCGMNVNCH